MYAPGSSITINPLKLDGRFQSAEHYQHTDQSKAFISEAEQAERRQNQALERIENGLGTLKGEYFELRGHLRGLEITRSQRLPCGQWSCMPEARYLIHLQPWPCRIGHRDGRGDPEA